MNTNEPNEPVLPDTPPEDTTAADLAAAMDAGIEVATEPAITAESAAPVPGTPEALEAERVAAEAAAAEAAKPPGETAEPAKPEPDAALEAEITGLALKDKAAARFRELTAEVKALAPLKAELEKVGIKDIAELPTIVQQAKDGADLFQLVQGTGANAEQFDGTLNYLALVNKGDPDSLNQAFDALYGELVTLAKIAGREVPGAVDPLAEHADLLAEIEGGDLTRARALEIAQGRARGKITEALKARDHSVTEQMTAAQQALSEGVTALRAWDAEQLAADPTYLAKRPALDAAVTQIRKDFPPQQWVAATKLAYQAIVAPATPPPPERKPPPGPMRPGLGHQTLAPAVYDDPMDAMEAGIAAASG